MMKADNLEVHLAALLEARRIAGSSLDLDHVLEAIVQQAAAISATPTVRLFLLEEDSRLLRCRVGMGIPKEVEKDLVVGVGESFSGQVAATGEPLAVTDCRGDPRLRYAEHVSRWGLISYLGLPVKVGDRVMAVLVFNTQTPQDYTPAEIAYLSSFASDAAIVIENARLHAAAWSWKRSCARHDLSCRNWVSRIVCNEWEVLRRLRADQRTRGLPVLVLTAGGQVEADPAMSLGASEFLSKPVSTRTLIGIVRELLTGGSPHPGHQVPEPEV